MRKYRHGANVFLRVTIRDVSDKRLVDTIVRDVGEMIDLLTIVYGRLDERWLKFMETQKSS